MTQCMVNNPEDCFGPCPCGERMPTIPRDVVQSRVKALLDAKSKQELHKHARVLVAFIIKQRHDDLPQDVKDAILAVETMA